MTGLIVQPSYITKVQDLFDFFARELGADFVPLTWSFNEKFKKLGKNKL